MTLDIQDIVQVRATIAPGGTIQPEFGRTMLVVTDADLDPGSQARTQVFADIGEVADVFASDSEAYEAALVYFSQSPYPRPLVVGRWLGVDRNAKPDRRHSGNAGGSPGHHVRDHDGPGRDGDQPGPVRRHFIRGRGGSNSDRAAGVHRNGTVDCRGCIRHRTGRVCRNAGIRQ